MLLDLLENIKNEFLSYFVPERIEYDVVGECKKCGKCCNYMYSFDTYTEKEFKIMQFLFPTYKRFYIKGKDNDGNLIFACKYVTKDGLCSDYEHRLPMCKKYPAKKILYKAKLHEGCGYKVIDKKFDDYLINGFIKNSTHGSISPVFVLCLLYFSSSNICTSVFFVNIFSL